MAINKFRGDATPAQKILRLISPGGSGIVQAEIRCGTRVFAFPEWSAAGIVATLNNSGVPEFANIAFTADISGDVIATGPLDEDFQISLTYRPTVTVTNETGVTPQNQITELDFAGARAGTYTLTINGLTTGAITYGDPADLISKINALSGWTAGDAVVRSQSPNAVLIEFTGTLAATPVSVVMDATNLRNGTAIFIDQKRAYTPGPHDVWMLGIEQNDIITLTIDGNSASLRSDAGLEETRQLIKSLAANAVEVYGGFLASGAGIARSHYILDFTGYSASSRPTISITSGGGSALKILNNPTTALLTTSAFATNESSAGYPTHYILDFTTGNSITLEYEGQPLTITNSFGNIQPDYSNTTQHTTYENAVSAVVNSLNDISNFADFRASVGRSFTTVGGAANWGDATYAPFSFFHPQIFHVIDNAANLTGAGIGPSLRQTGGTGTLRLINQPGSAAAAAIHRVWLPAKSSSGTFQLVFPEGTTSAIAWNASAATIEGLLDSLIDSGLSVSGSGTPGSPWEIIYTTALKSRPLPTGLNVAIGGYGIGSAGTLVGAIQGRTQTAEITISSNAVAGSFSLNMGQQGPVVVPLNTSAASLRTLLAALPAIGNADNLIVTYNSAAQSYEITFTSALANKLLPVFSLAANNLDTITADTVDVTQQATGPRNWADPANWSLGRLPAATDEVVLDGSDGDIVYGLRQWVQVQTLATFTPQPTTTTSTTSSTTTSQPPNLLTRLQAIGGHDFRNGQQVRLTTSTTLPGGLSAGVTYYVLDADNEDGTFQLSATAGGSPITITSAGTGTHYCGLLASAIRITSQFADDLGREERATNFVEYRPRYLKIGLASGGLCEIGAGVGRGSSLLRLDFGRSAGTLRLLRTSTTAELDRQALCILSAVSTLDIEAVSGELGIATFDEETSTVGRITQNSGTVVCGNVSATEIVKTGGRMLTRNLSVSGNVGIRG